jgi:hypothetical protein
MSQILERFGHQPREQLVPNVVRSMMKVKAKERKTNRRLLILTE